MQKERFDLKGWREGQQKRMSKAKAARKMGIDAHTYDKYEREGLCPVYVKLSTLAIDKWNL